MRFQYLGRTVHLLCILAVVCDGGWKVGVIYQTDEWIDLQKPNNLSTVFEITQDYINGTNALTAAQKVYNISSGGVFGIIAFTSCVMAPVIKSQANDMHTPVINIVKRHCPADQGDDVQLSSIPNCSIQNSLIINISLHMRWQRMNIIYDSSAAMCIQDLLTCMSMKNVSGKVVFLSDGIPINSALAIIGRRWMKEVIYVSTVEQTALDVISAALELDMFNSSYYWILNLRPHKLWNTTAYIQVHRGYVLVISPHRQHNGTISQALLYDALSIFQRVLNFSRGTCNSSDSGSMNNELPSHLTTINLMTTPWINDCDILGTSELRVYSTNKKSWPPLQEVAVYSPTNGLHISEERLYKNIFSGFHNRTLRVASVEGEPFQMRVDEGNGKFYFYGFTYDILDEFAKEFSFRYEILDSVDGLYGNPTGDGQRATGIIGMVMRGEADIGVSGFTITKERKTVVDFLYPFQEEGIGIIMKKVDNKAGKMFRVFSPFATDSWIATVAAVVVAGIVLSLIAKLSPFNTSSGLKESVSRSFWLAFSTFLHQSEEKTPKSVSGRIVLGIWWMFTIIIVSLYTANLAAFFTISLAKAPIDSLQELASQTVYKPLIKQGSNLHTLFQNAEEGLYKKIWDMMADMPKIKVPEEGYAMIVEGKYAYMTDESETKYKAMSDCMNLEVAKETFHKAELSFVIKKEAEFKDAFNNHMLKMVEGGIVDKYKTKWWPQNNCPSSTTATELVFENTSGIFVVYGGFLVISLTCFIIEVLFIQGKKHAANKVQSPPEDTKEISLIIVDL